MKPPTPLRRDRGALRQKGGDFRPRARACSSRSRRRECAFAIYEAAWGNHVKPLIGRRKLESIRPENVTAVQFCENLHTVSGF
jgi:hypothetical protein